MFYHIEDKLRPADPGAPVEWHKTLAVLTPGELSQYSIPEMLMPPSDMLSSGKNTFCRLITEQDRIIGEIHVPKEPRHKEKSIIFIWWKTNILFVDHDGEAAECIDRIMDMRPHHADGADDLLMDFYLALILDDLSYIQKMEVRISELEQMVLDNSTEKFISRMSALRKELIQYNRFYAQMIDMVSSLQENTDDLLDEVSSARLQYILRRLNRLQSETQMLREYASQVSSEYQAQTDLEQNRVMKLLTIVTTIFMPLSLIAGWYGMNFVNMPELKWIYGYPAVIALSLIIVGGCIYFFKKKRYW